jgi:hypothetical protein
MVYVAIATGTAEILIIVVLVVRAVIMAGRKPPVTDARFRALVEEHRRTADQARTASEQVNRKLADLSSRVDELRHKVDRILADAE